MNIQSLQKNGKESAKRLKTDKNFISIEKVYSSDLKRAIDTAKYAKPGYKINIDKRLRERSLGEFEGKYPEDLEKSEEYKKYIINEDYNKFRRDFVQKAPNGENYTDVINRTKDFLNSINMSEDITIGIFSHMHCIRSIFFNLLNISPREKLFNMKIENCVPYVIERNKDGKFCLTSHELSKLYNKICW